MEVFFRRKVLAISRTHGISPRPNLCLCLIKTHGPGSQLWPLHLLFHPAAFAGEADIHIPDLSGVKFDGLGGVTGATLMFVGIGICCLGAIFGLGQQLQTRALPVHQCMSQVSESIWETCKTYLFTQGKFLAILWVLIAGCMVYYFLGLQHEAIGNVVLILLCSVLGILGSYGVARFRHPHQHSVQLAHRLFRAQSQSLRHPWHPVAFGHERRVAARLR